MQITVAKNAGFCFGVKNAIEIAKANSSNGIYTIGQLIHNSNVVDNLEKSGIKSITDISTLKKGDKAVIRAHGISPKIEKELKDKGVILFDATCPFVKKIHKICHEYYTKGYKIIIVGDKNHDEVQSINGYADNNAQIINDINQADLTVSDKFAVLSQTTFSFDKFTKIVENIKKLTIYNSKTVVFFNTICYTTKAKQDEAEYLSKTNDAVIVIGDKSSSNCNRLLEIAKSNCKNTFLIQKVSDIKSVMISKYNTMAVLAAASTPEELIEEVLSSMSDTQNNEVLENSAVENTATEEVSTEATTTVLKEQKIADTKKSSDEEITMEDILSSAKTAGFTTYREGKRIRAKIIDVTENGIYIEIGGKKDGFIDKSEVNIDRTYNPSDFKAGDDIDAIIIKKSDNTSYVNLSKREVDIIKKNDEEALKAFDSKEFTVEPPLKIVKNKEGNPVGLEGRLGAFTVFIPGSQIRIGRVNNLEDYLEKKLRLRMLQKNGHRVTASQRVILEEEKTEREESFWATVIPGAVVNGKVKRFASFGAFVSVKGHDCLAHVSDLSWKKIAEPAEVLELNKNYDFIVLKADRESGKISLGYKQLQKKPYEIAAEKYPVGTVIKGTIARIHPFGAFVQIEDGIDGLIHVSQISHKYVKEASELLHEGQEVEAKIISFEGNRITLSMKELEEVPEKVEEKVEKSNDMDKIAEEVENAPKTTARPRNLNKFKYTGEKSEAPRRERQDRSDEPHEWVSDSGNATLADLLKDFHFNLEEEDK